MGFHRFAVIGDHGAVFRRCPAQQVGIVGTGGRRTEIAKPHGINGWSRGGSARCDKSRGHPHHTKTASSSWAVVLLPLPHQGADAHDGVMLPIPGTSKVAHLEDNMGALQVELSDADFAALNN